MGSNARIPTVRPDDWVNLNRVLRKLSFSVLGADSSPTFADVTLTDLTAVRLVATDASKKLISSDLVNWVAGTANRVTVTDDADGTITLSGPQDIHTGATPTFAGLTLNGNLDMTGDDIVNGGTGTFGTIDFGTNTITDGAMVGDWIMTGDVTITSTSDNQFIIKYDATQNATFRTTVAGDFTQTITGDKYKFTTVNSTNNVEILAGGGNNAFLDIIGSSTTLFRIGIIGTEGRLDAINGATSISFQRNADIPIIFFDNADPGETEELRIKGRNATDSARRHLAISIDPTVDNAALFSNLAAYNFAGNVGITGTLGVSGITTLSDMLVLPKTTNVGIKVDTTTPTFGFADIIGDQFSKNTGATKPVLAAYNGVVQAWQFSNGDEAYMSFHIPHDYVAGSDIHLHIHWSQNAAGATGGTLDFRYTAIYAKSHDQVSGATFTATPKTALFSTIDINDGGSGLNQYQQFLTEVTISAATATAALFDRDDFEPDGVIEMTLEMDADNLTGTPSSPFIHFVDIHYQTTGLIGTKSRTPDFYA